MTYTEIIDNIQTRIENLIAERFSGTYTNIKIDPSNYNPEIDDEITITITVTDQNDDPISNWNVPLQINGTLVPTTLTTDTNGQVTYTHSCDDWGVCRFSVKAFSTVINVTGFKVFTITSAVKLYVDGTNAILRLNQLSFSGASANVPKLVYTLPSDYQSYAPPETLVTNDYNVNRTIVYGANSQISVVQTTSGGGNINTSFTYAYR